MNGKAFRALQQCVVETRNQGEHDCMRSLIELAKQARAELEAARELLAAAGLVLRWIDQNYKGTFPTSLLRAAIAACERKK